MNENETQSMPPWTNVDPRAVVANLTNQLAGMLQVIAMRDAYIDQLHKALADIVAADESEE